MKNLGRNPSYDLCTSFFTSLESLTMHLLFYVKDRHEDSSKFPLVFHKKQQHMTTHIQYDACFVEWHSCISLFQWSYWVQWQWKVLKDPKQWNLSLESAWVIWGQSGKPMMRESILLFLGIGTKTHIHSHSEALLSVLEAEQARTASVNGSFLTLGQIRTCSYVHGIKTCVQLWHEHLMSLQ